MLPHFRFTRQHSPLITPLCYSVEVVPYPFQFRNKFVDTVRIHDLLPQHTRKDIFLLVVAICMPVGQFIGADGVTARCV